MSDCEQQNFPRKQNSTPPAYDEGGHTDGEDWKCQPSDDQGVEERYVVRLGDDRDLEAYGCPDELAPGMEPESGG